MCSKCAPANSEGLQNKLPNYWYLKIQAILYLEWIHHLLITQKILKGLEEIALTEYFADITLNNSFYVRLDKSWN